MASDAKVSKTRKAQKLSLTVNDSALFHALGVELLQLSFDFLREMEVTSADQLKMLSAVQHTGRKRTMPSRAVLQKLKLASDMLSLWRTDKRYAAADGSPSVLPIYGRRPSLEHLARQFLPDVPMDEVLRMITRQGEVQRHKEDRVALAGRSVVFHEKTKEQTLAWFIARARALAASSLHNIPEAAGVKGSGFIDRLVHTDMSEKKFREFSQGIRPQIQNLCDHVEAGMQSATDKRRGRNDKASGLVLFLFREDGSLY